MPLIRKDKKAVILKLRNPSRVTTVIPTAKLVQHEGATLVAVPHRPDEVRILRNLGFDAPDPMPLYYGWPKAGGRYDPFEAQVKTASFATLHDRLYILNSMGTGKTVSSLWAYDYLHSLKVVDKVLVVCPLSTMELTWAHEAFRTFPHLNVTVLHGTADRRRKLLSQDANIYVVNHDGVNIIKDDLENRPDINLVIVDELAVYRNAGTTRWKAINTVINKQCTRKVWGLTGMPTPNSPLDAWAQCRLVTPNDPQLPRYSGKAKELLMRQVSSFKWLPRDDAAETVKGWMQPSIRFSLDDCTDLPPQMRISREVALTPDQRAAYKDMFNQLRAQHQGGEILAVNDSVKVNKLIQIACGVAYGKDGSEIVIPATERLNVVKEVIDESEGKVIVFVPLTGVLHYVTEALRAEYGADMVAQIYGETSKRERDQIFTDFQNHLSPRIIVANPGTMSHGLTLTAATTIIWYAPIHNNDIYEQACARVRRPGQTRSTVIVHIGASEAERRVYDRLERKQQMQGILLELMNEVRSG